MEINWKKVSESLHAHAAEFHKQATAGTMSRDAAHVMLGAGAVMVGLAKSIDAGIVTGEPK